jgi:Skp family chaperone for outer membrane proteins
MKKNKNLVRFFLGCAGAILVTGLSAAETGGASSVSPVQASSAGSSDKGGQVAPVILSFDANRVIQRFDLAGSRDAELKLRAESLKADGEKKVEELVNGQKEAQELAEKIDNPALSDEARDKMKTEAEKLIETLREKEMNFQQWQEEASAQLNDMRLKALSKTVEEIKSIASEIAKRRGAVIVLNATSPDILYVSPDTDISDEIIPLLNQRYPAPVKNAILPKTAAGDKAK